MLDYEQLAGVAADHPLPLADERFGAPGVSAAVQLMDLVRSVYQTRAYELLPEGFVAFTVLEGEGPDSLDEGRPLQSLNDLVLQQPAGLTIQLKSDGSLEMWPEVREDVPRSGALVYEFRSKAETFFVDGEPRTLPNFGLPSILIAPTFFDLEESLDHYAIHLVRLSQCPTLTEAWRDENRLMLLRGPEARMRKSLARHLTSSLRDHRIIEVREEQNVDESHPVDIKVTWAFSPNIALIEIKWLGKSADPEDDHVSTEFGASRAREGAEQLAEYLDWNRPHSILHNTIGYLVIFDARRRGVNTDSRTITLEDGFYYESRDIAFDEGLTERLDFGTPRRMFIEPVCV